jgi:hypothetical protein
MIKQLFTWFKSPAQKREVLFRAQEIWWCSLDGGTEGPVLVFRKFNSGAFWGLPLSARTNGKEAPLYMLASLQGKSQAALSRMRTLDSSQLVRRVGKISSRQFSVLNSKVVNLLQETDPSRVRMAVRTHKVRSANPRTLIRRADPTSYRHVSHFLPTLSLRTR